MTTSVSDSRIETCRWLTTTHKNSKPHELQNFFSDWTNSQLGSVLEASFQHVFGQRENWRLEALEIDLGSIPEGDISSELPLRIRSALDDAFRTLLTKATTSQVAESRSITQDPLIFLEFFLSTGQLPWWWNNQGQVDDAATRILLADGQSVSALVRRIGQHKTVRQRIAWQLGTQFFEVLVSKLEPSHAEYIVSFAREIIVSKAFPAAKCRNIHLDIREWILQHLIVERGSLFNTVSFVRSTLQQMAANLNLSFDEVLEELWAAASVLSREARHQPEFLQAVSLLRKEKIQHNQPTLKSHAVSNQFEWQKLAKALKSDASVITGTHQSHGAWFEYLVSKTGHLGRRWILEHGKDERFRASVIRRFNHLQLVSVLQLIEPSESAFITAHVHLVTSLQNPAPVIKEYDIWHVVLAFLIRRNDSHFQRRQFIEHTIQKIAQQRGLTFSVLLSFLTTGTERLGYDHRYSLLTILLDLRSIHVRKLARVSRVTPFLSDLFSSQKTLRELNDSLEYLLFQEPNNLYRALVASRNSEQLAMRLVELKPDHRLKVMMILVRDQQVIQLFKALATSAAKGLLSHVMAEVMRHQTLTAESFFRLRIASGFSQDRFEQWIRHLIKAGDEPAGFKLYCQRYKAQDIHHHSLKNTNHPMRKQFEPVNLSQACSAVSEACEARPAARAAMKRLLEYFRKLSRDNQSDAERWLTPALIAALSLNTEEISGHLYNLISELIERHNVKPLQQRVLVATTKHSVNQLQTSPLIEELLEHGLPVPNAGLVLIQSFLGIFFERLELMMDGKFLSVDARQQAVLQLNFLATDQQASEEHLLALNKVLAGSPLTESVGASLDSAEVNEPLVNSLITAMISHWPSIGSTSIEGFRGNWLIRSGILHKSKDHWTLVVEKKGYDILLPSAPFSYSIVNLPWMTAPLFVTWPT